MYVQNSHSNFAVIHFGMPETYTPINLSQVFHDEQLCAQQRPYFHPVELMFRDVQQLKADVEYHLRNNERRHG